MKMKFFLALTAMAAFLALPALAQHGHGGGHGSESMHGMDHSSSHEHDAESHGGHGDHGKDADDDHDGKHGSGHDSGHKTAAQLLTQNSKLSSKLQSLLPPGTDLQTAAAGFKNLGQFVAAVHVSKNLGIPFDQLKSTMLGPPAQSLGKAVHTLQPSANTKAAVKTAEKQAHTDLESSENEADNDSHDASSKHHSNAVHDTDSDDSAKK